MSTNKARTVGINVLESVDTYRRSIEPAIDRNTTGNRKGILNARSISSNPFSTPRSTVCSNRNRCLANRRNTVALQFTDSITIFYDLGLSKKWSLDGIIGILIDRMSICRRQRVSGRLGKPYADKDYYAGFRSRDLSVVIRSILVYRIADNVQTVRSRLCCQNT